MVERASLLVLAASNVEDVNSRTVRIAGERVHTISGAKTIGNLYRTL